MSETRDGAVLHRREITERVGIRERAVFVETLLEIGARHVVEAAGVGAVVPREDPALGVDLDSERVAAPFGKYLETPCLGMITPDVLAEGI